jgi:cell division protein FtsB
MLATLENIFYCVVMISLIIIFGLAILCQKAEKEALIAGQETLQKYIAEQKAEIERLHSEVKETRATIDSFTDIGKLYSEIKAEAIKEFAERLKAKEATHFCKCGQPFVYTDLFNGEIDNLVKEMVGDTV